MSHPFGRVPVRAELTNQFQGDPCGPTSRGTSRRCPRSGSIARSRPDLTGASYHWTHQGRSTATRARSASHWKAASTAATLHTPSAGHRRLPATRLAKPTGLSNQLGFQTNSALKAGLRRDLYHRHSLIPRRVPPRRPSRRVLPVGRLAASHGSRARVRPRDVRDDGTCKPYSHAMRAPAAVLVLRRRCCVGGA